MEKLNSKLLKDFYEAEATWKSFWGSLREKLLVENILLELRKGKVKRVLEVGMGDGFLLYSLKRVKPEVEIYGVDISRKRVVKASKALKDYGGYFVIADATALPFKAKAFDYLVYSEVLEHIPDNDLVLSEAYRVLQSEGSILITVPFKQNLVQIMCPYCHRLFNPDGHIHSYDENKLVQITHKAGFKVVKLRGFGSWLANNRFTRTLPFVIRYTLDKISYYYSKSARYWILVGQKPS